nr:MULTISPECIES: RHS repeat-associated core domain-containing protein [unclassified Listeria]
MARYYEPSQGVFTAYDPDPGDEDDPQTMNGYNYANNNPVMYVDSDGNFAFVIPVVYWGYGAAIAATPVVGYGIGKGSKWAWKKTGKFRKQCGTLWKYRKPIRKATVRTVGKMWKRSISKFSKGGKKNVRDSGLMGLSNVEILARYKSATGAAKKRYEKELKARGFKNVQKRKGK